MKGNRILYKLKRFLKLFLIEFLDSFEVVKAAEKACIYFMAYTLFYTLGKNSKS